MRTRILELLSKMQIEKGERISITEMGRETGVSRQTIHRWISGDLSSLDIDTVKAFCIFFKCEIQDLLFIDWDAPDPET